MENTKEKLIYDDPVITKCYILTSKSMWKCEKNNEKRHCREIKLWKSDWILSYIATDSEQAVFSLDFETMNWSKFTLNTSIGRSLRSPVLVPTGKEKTFFVLPSKGPLESGFCFNLDCKVIPLGFVDDLRVKKLYVAFLGGTGEIVLFGHFLRAAAGALYGQSPIIRLYLNPQELKHIAEARLTSPGKLPRKLALRFDKAWRPQSDPWVKKMTNWPETFTHHTSKQC